MKYFFIRLICFLNITLLSNTALATSADQLYEEALQAFNAKEYAQAIVLLKNTMFENSKHLSGRILLGRTLMLSSDFDDAEKQFRQALVDGADSSQILVPLGQSLLLQGKYQALLEIIKPDNNTSAIDTELASLRGRAYLELNQYHLARERFEYAIKIAPYEAVGYLGLAVLELKMGNITTADQWVEKVFSIDSANAEALQLKGDIYYQQGKLLLAKETLNQSLMLDEKSLRGRLLLAEIYLAESDIDQALKHILYVLEIKPNYPNANLLYAFALYKSDKKNDATKIAKNISAYLSKIDEKDFNKYPSLRLIQGTSLYMQESWENAYSHLSYYAHEFPGHEQSHLMVANMDMRFERYKNALEILEHYNGEQKSLEHWLLNLAALVKLGKHFEALVVVDQALLAFPEKIELLEYKSKLLLATNDLPAALSLLEHIYKKGNASEQTAILLGQLQLSLAQVEKASSVVQKLLLEQPDNPVYLSLSAGIDLRSNDAEQARKKLEKALKISPKMLQIYVNLYYVYLSQGRMGEAAAILNKAHKISPTQPFLLSKLAELAEQVHNVKVAINWREKLYQLQPDNLDNLVHYADDLMRDDQADLALKIIESHRMEFRLNVQYLSRLAAVHVKLKQCSDADQVLGVLYGLSLNKVEHLTVIADLYMQCRRFELANRAITSAEDLDIKNISVQLVRARWLLDINQAKLALKLLTPLANNNIMKAMQLQVSAYETLNDDKNAIISAKNLYNAYPMPITVYKLFTLLLTYNKPDEATQVLEQYLVEHENMNIQRSLANEYLRQGKVEKAQALYSQLAKTDNDAYSYRQLAIISAKQDINQAVVYAQKAHQIDEKSPAIAATYGWLLVQSGKPTEGLALLRYAHARNANQPTLLYRLGETLMLLNQPEQAKAFYLQASKFDFPFKEQAIHQLTKLSN